MTNPGAAMRMLITYAICIPLAILVGYLVTGPMDFGTLGIFGAITMLLISPVLIRWRYPIMVFGVGCMGAYVFFLKGNPPLWQVATAMCLGLAIVERTMNSDYRFISAPVMTRPLLFLAGVVYFTAKLTGGIGMRSMGSDVGGGQKYMWVFLGICEYFALTSFKIPKEKRIFYVGLFYLANIPIMFSDLFPVLPGPLKYINLFFPPSAGALGEEFSFSSTRLGFCATAAGAGLTFMLARFGLRGIFMGKAWRAPFFMLLFALTLFGGFRSWLMNTLVILVVLFFLEKLYRTRLLMVFTMALVVATAVLVPFAHKLPNNFQRCLTFLPLKLNPEVVADAEGSKGWREEMWADLWPQVPGYLLLGKGYALSAADFRYMGGGTFAGQDNASGRLDKSKQSLALSGDYHNGPLSVLMPFGIWGALGFLWLEAAAMYVLIRNYRYGDPELKTVNALLMVQAGYLCFSYVFIYGAFATDVGLFSKWVGFSVALNWGVCRPKAASAPPVRIRQPRPRPALA